MKSTDKAQGHEEWLLSDEHGLGEREKKIARTINHQTASAIY